MLLAALRHDERPSRSWGLMVGLIAGAALAVRLPNALFVAPILAWGLFRRPRDPLARLVPAAALLMGALAYNLSTFGHALGLYSATRFDLLGIDRLAGVLASPNRGLLTYFPLAILGAFGFARRGRTNDAVDSLSLALGSFVVLQVLLVATFQSWWGGISFGPRLFAEVQPVLLLLAVPLFAGPRGLRWRSIALTSVFLAWSVFVQAVGAFLWIGAWDIGPPSVDAAPSRLWDWRDTQVFRDLKKERVESIPYPPLVLRSWGAEYGVPARLTSAAGARVQVPIRVRNTSSDPWPSVGMTIDQLRIQLSYFLAPAGSPAPRLNGPHTKLPHVVRPGESALVYMTLDVPDVPGDYVVDVTLVQELVDWFENRSVPPGRIALHVIPGRG